jgi:BirA family biotin operon repressor/biotin-[acetyl-CoA-carboxylase] ligase
MTPTWYFLNEIDSTNNEAKRILFGESPTHPICVVAEAQTAGRGTQGKSWSSPTGAGIYLSVGVATRASPVPEAATLSISTGSALASLLSRRAKLAVSTKGVNDLFVGDRKLGGILCECTVRGDSCESIVVGIGLNVLDVPRSLDQPDYQPTSLQQEMPANEFAMLDVASLTKALANATINVIADAAGLSGYIE